jgi:WD40 repeat protein
VADKHEPYVGPRPFTQDDKSYFFGRDREANELLSLIIAHPVVLLYAQSGAGKTSLLNASIIPLLEKRSSQIFGPARVSGQIPPEINQKDVPNIYVFHTLLSLESDIPDEASLTKMSFGQYLKTRPSPPRVEGLSTRRVVIFDQFEEVFTTSPERWNERESFFDSVGSALEEDPSLRVVFAMREEYLASMDPYTGLLPERLRTRFRLERLRKEPALLAVKKPVEKTDRTFAPGAAEQLVESLLKVPIKSASGVVVDVSEEFIEPVQLQVVCQNLWQKLPPEVKVIDEKYIEGYGDVDQALSTYYDNCIAKVVEEFKGQVVEGELRRWFGTRIITPDGIRGIVYKDDSTGTTGGLPNNVVARLEDLRLVRPELRGGAAWYELTHDRFIGPIRQSNLRWLAERDKGNITSQSLEARAENWHIKGRNNKDLLWGYELGEVKDWMRSPYAMEIGVSNTLKDFFKASKDKMGRTRLLQLLGAVAILLIAAVAFAFYFFSARREAEDARLIERGIVASTFSAQRKPFDALVWGIKAVASEVNKGKEPPKEAVDGLRTAVALMADTLWLPGLSSPVEHVDFSPDGRLALAWNSYEATVWDAATGQRLYDLKSNDISNNRKEGDQNKRWDRLYFSSDGRLLIATYAGSYRRERETVKRVDERDADTHVIWDAQTGKPFVRLQQQLKGVSSITFSPDSTRIMAAEINGWIRLLNAESGEHLTTLPVKNPSLMEFLPQGSRAVTMSGNVVQIWDTGTGEQVRKFSTSASEMDRPVLSHEGNRLALWYWARDLSPSIWDLNTGRQVIKFAGAYSNVGDFEFSPDDKSVALITFGLGKVEANIMDASTGNLLFTRAAPAGFALVVREDARIVINQNQGGKTTIFVWDPFSGNVLVQLKDIPSDFAIANASPDLSRIIAYIKEEKDNFVYIWKVNQAPFDAGKLSTVELYRRACDLLHSQPDQYDQVKSECEQPLSK